MDDARNCGVAGWNATKVNIELIDDGTLTIVDNGRGMSYEELNPAGFRLKLTNQTRPTTVTGINSSSLVMLWYCCSSWQH